MNDNTKNLSTVEKRALVEKLLKEKKQAAKSQRPDRFPLTPAQQRLWFIEQLQPGIVAYNMPFALRISGDLNIDALQQSFSQLIERHEILRTAFINEEGKPWQKISPKQDLAIEVETVKQADLETALKKLVNQAFVLDQAPLYRAKIFQLAENDYVFALVMHHSIMDFSSLQIIYQEIFSAYYGITTNNIKAVEKLSIQYGDYAVWLNQQSTSMQQGLNYWQKKLQDAPTQINLPFDFQRPKKQSFSGARAPLTINSASYQRFKTMAQQQQATPFMAMLAAFNILLFRYTNDNDCCVGTTISNRERAELRPLIGLFVNTLVIRNTLNAQSSFLDFLKTVKQTALEAYQYQAVPFEKIVDALDIPRNISHNALFQVMFNLHSYQNEEITLDNINIKPVEFTGKISRFDLSLDLYENKDGSLSGFFEYSTDLFKPATVQRIADNFTVLVESICQNPEQAMIDLDVISTSEQQHIVSFQQGKTTEKPAFNQVNQLIEKQVEKTPAATAVVYGNTTLSYQSLNEQANQLAHYLINVHLIEPGEKIAVCFNASPNLLIAILAVIKIGGSYIPIDPRYPLKRIEYILENSQAKLFLSEKTVSEAIFKENHDTHSNDTVILIDQIQQQLIKQNTDNINSQFSEQQLLYLIYTSGSTGQPKATAVSHANELNLLQWFIREYQFNDQDKHYIISAIGFDLTQKNLFAGISSGGCVVFPETTHYDPLHYKNDIQRHQVTRINLAPSAFYPIIENINADELSSLKTVFLGGETIKSSSVKHWLSQTDCELVNMYGPTECSDITTSYTVQNDDLYTQHKTIPIGKPINNVNTHVLHKNSYQTTAIGVIGELCISGKSVSQGYIYDAVQQNEKFVDNPFNSQSLLYRTGDLVRWRDDGLLEYIDRIDTQIKLRGLRIEAGEIENLLQKHPLIHQAVVDLFIDDNQQQYLSTWCVLAAKQNNQNIKDIQFLADEQQQAIQLYLENHLPEYMIPHLYIQMPELPISANGKIDRKKLKVPEFTHHTDREIISPETSTEALVAEIWAEVLNKVTISRFDNFFNIGGHSILAARVIARLQPTFMASIPLLSIFEHPTLKEFAQSIDQLLDENLKDHRGIHIPKIDRNGHLPLSFAQQRQWTLAQLEPDSAFYNMPIAINIKGALNVSALNSSINQLVKRQEALRSAVIMQDNIAQLIISADLSLAIESIDLRHNNEQLQQSMEQTAAIPFDLTQAPLLRVTLFQLAEQEHVLLIVMHHIIGDALSNSVLMRDLATLYSSTLHNKGQQQSPTLPELGIQYVDYAAWQRQLNLDEQKNYWQKELQDAPPLLSLVTDYIRPVNQTFSGSSVRFELTEQQVYTINKVSQQQQATTFMCMLASFALLLSRYSETQDIVIGVPIANRPHRELENIIGMFLNTLAVRSQFSYEESFNTLLNQVRQKSLQAFKNQDIPFEQVVESLNLARNWSYNPVFQAMFVWKTQEQQMQQSIEGLDWQPLVLADNFAKVDIALVMNQTDTGINGKIEYRNDLFKEASISAMVDTFLHIIDELADKSQIPLKNINYLPPKHEQQINLWNSKNASLSCQHLTDFFELSLQKYPTATAVIDQQQAISYVELAQQIERIAAVLQDNYQTTEPRVGILLSRHNLMISAILASLKSGAAYVPLDPNYPKDRLAYICEDANITALISEADHRELATAIYNGPIIDINNASKTHNKPFKPVTYYASQLAYIIYTSGSTGRPKGVAIEHQSAISLVDWAIKNFNAEQLAGTLASTSICFDLSIFEIFVPLSIGASVIVADNLFHLADHPARNQVTLINTVPTAAAELLRIYALPHSVSTVNLAGEAVPNSLIDDLYKLPSINTVYNLYGPSEDTTYSTWCRLANNTQQTVLQDSAVPIGQVIDNSQAYILNEQQQPLAIGMIGELYLAGKGLARGYWQQQAMTDERFITVDHLENTKTRLYRTSDKVRRRADGNIEFLGRIDHQVKLRGFRIELSEIDTLLLKHSQIIQAATLLNDKHLSAYIVIDKSVDISGQDNLMQLYDVLSNHLKLNLPDYMLPKDFYLLAELPLLPNGKIDRKSLTNTAAIEHLQAPSLTSTTAQNSPFNAMEHKIAKQWQKVLGSIPQSTNDNFFQLGGDSIQAIQLVAALREENIQFMPRDIFLYATLSEQAKIAENRPLISIDQSPIAGPVPLLPIQHWFFEQQFIKPHHWNQSLLFKCKQALNPELLKQSLEILSEHHDSLRASFTQHQQQWQQTISDVTAFDLPFTYSKQTVKDNKAFIETNNQQCQASFTFDGKPLWHCHYYEVTDAESTEYRLFISAHHLLIDGVSWRILLNDLQLIYLSLSDNSNVVAALPSKSSSIKQWSEYLLEQSKAISNDELEYWQSAANQDFQLPLSYQEQRFYHQYSKIHCELNHEWTEKLIKEAPQSFAVQINDLLLAALLQSIAQWTGNYQLKLQLESHGRSDLCDNIDLSRTLAWFTAIYPLYLSTEDDDIGNTIKSVKQQLREVPNDGIGYGVIRYLTQTKDLTNGLHNAPIRFNYLGQLDQAIDQNALFSVAEEDIGTTQYQQEKSDVFIDISAMIKDEKLVINWRYHESIEQTIMQKVSDEFIKRLQAIIEYCLQQDSNTGLIAADFPEMNFSDGELDDILSNL